MGFGQGVLSGGQALLGGAQCNLGWVASGRRRGMQCPRAGLGGVHGGDVCGAAPIPHGRASRESKTVHMAEPGGYHVATTHAHPLVSPASENSLTWSFMEPPVGIEPTTFSLRVNIRNLKVIVQQTVPA